MSGVLLRRLVCIVAGLWAVAARTQSGDLQLESRPSALQCLTSTQPQRTTPDYPTAALTAAKGAVVRVRLRFVEAGGKPGAEVVFNSGDDAFAEAVHSFVASYRLPCLAASAPAIEATQEFQFVPKIPDPVVFWNRPRGEATDADNIDRECLRSVIQAEAPSYPSGALRGDESGVVLVRMKFVAAEAEPEIDILYDAGSHALAGAVRTSVRKYRMPCLKAGGGPVAAIRQFKFALEGGQESVLRSELSLVQLVGLVRDLEKERVRFDFNTMNCPFDVKLLVYQPYLRNSVGEVAETRASRREFLEWLQGVSLQIPSRAMKTVIGQAVTVSVPCTVLDLL